MSVFFPNGMDATPQPLMRSLFAAIPKISSIRQNKSGCFRHFVTVGSKAKTMTEDMIWRMGTIGTDVFFCT